MIFDTKVSQFGGKRILTFTMPISHWMKMQSWLKDSPWWHLEIHHVTKENVFWASDSHWVCALDGQLPCLHFSTLYCLRWDRHLFSTWTQFTSEENQTEWQNPHVSCSVTFKTSGNASPLWGSKVMDSRFRFAVCAFEAERREWKCQAREKIWQCSILWGCNVDASALVWCHVWSCVNADLSVCVDLAWAGGSEFCKTTCCVTPLCSINAEVATVMRDAACVRWLAHIGQDICAIRGEGAKHLPASWKGAGSQEHAGS